MIDPTIPKFLSVTFYPAYRVESVFARGRYIALGEDGRVYCMVMDGSDCWTLVGGKSYD
jgi:hypothetical protein